MGVGKKDRRTGAQRQRRGKGEPGAEPGQPTSKAVGGGGFGGKIR